MGNESGYGSEPGYRGDAEIGHGDEFDEEEADSKLCFGEHIQNQARRFVLERKSSQTKNLTVDAAEAEGMITKLLIP